MTSVRLSSQAIALVGMIALGLECSRPAPSSPQWIDAGDAELGGHIPARSAIGAPAPSQTPPARRRQPVRLATTQIIDPGKPPRSRLRYSWRVGRPEELTMDLRTAASTDRDGTHDPGVVLPSVRITLAINPTEVSSAGDLRYEWHVLSAHVLDDSDAAAFVADGLRREVDAVAFLAGEATVDARGLAKDVSVRGDAEVDPGDTPQMVEQIRQTLRDLSAPFPEEKVGVGGRWRKVSEIHASNVRLEQGETLTLLEGHAGHGVVQDELTQMVLGQTSGSRSADSGVPSMLATGQSRTRFDLERLVPQTVFDGTTEMVTPASTDGRSQRMTMILRVSISIEGSVR